MRHALVILVLCHSIGFVVADPVERIGNVAFDRSEVATGKVLYLDNCAVGCHLSNLEGAAPSPPLLGREFQARWEGILLAEFIEKIAKTMPLGNPGVLSAEEYRSIAAFIINQNSF